VQEPAPPPGWLPPFAEIVERRPGALRGAALAEAARVLLLHHLNRAPDDPFGTLAASIGPEMETLRAAGQEAFHHWAFATLRQAGAAFELLGIHAAWLAATCGCDALGAVEACGRIAASAKTLQFRAARAMRGGDTAALAAGIRVLGEDRTVALDGLRTAFS
jgi:hypothetical protein